MIDLLTCLKCQGRANDGLRIIADQADITQLLTGHSVIQRQTWPSIRGLCRATAELEWFSRGKGNISSHVAGLIELCQPAFA